MFKVMTDYVEGKDVLDIGCVAHSISQCSNPNWLHGIICKHAESVLGVDILEKEIDILRERGFNVICGNAETINLDKKFDVIVAGDVIGQLSNMGLFLDNLHRHLNDGGRLIIYTGNAKCWWILKQLFFGDGSWFANHTVALYNVHTLFNILERHSFEVEEAFYCDSKRSMMCKCFPSISDTIFIVVKKKDVNA